MKKIFLICLAILLLFFFSYVVYLGYLRGLSHNNSKAYARYEKSRLFPTVRFSPFWAAYTETSAKIEGRTLTVSVRSEFFGFFVVQDAIEDKQILIRHTILGVSNRFEPKGLTSQTATIPINRDLKDGEYIFISFYDDDDQDGTFNPEKDTIAVGSFFENYVLYRITRSSETGQVVFKATQVRKGTNIEMMQKCSASGGVFIDANHSEGDSSCGDLCSYSRGGNSCLGGGPPIYCDCGVNSCWNGDACEQTIKS